MRPVLVTGAGKGLGAEICRQLAAKGHDVVIHFNTSEKQAERVAEECRVHNVHATTFQGDFSTLESVNQFLAAYLKEIPQTKGLVNNVGNYLIAQLCETQITAWQDLFQTNFFAPILLSQALLPSLRQHKGTIVNIGLSGLANQVFIKAPAYAASKSALYFYTLSLAKEMAKDFVRVNMVSPGYMENATDLHSAPPLPFKRPAFLHEVAHLVTSLFDPESSYITGQNIEVAGGFGL